MNDSQDSSNSGKWIAAVASVLVCHDYHYLEGYMAPTKSVENPHFSGIVRGPDEEPISNAAIQVSLDQQTPQSTRSDSAGAFHVEVPSSTQTMHITVYADGFKPFDVDANPHRTGPEPIYLPRTSPVPKSRNNAIEEKLDKHADSKFPSGTSAQPPVNAASVSLLPNQVPPRATFIQSPVPIGRSSQTFTDPNPEEYATNPGVLITVRVDILFSTNSHLLLKSHVTTLAL